MCFDKCVKNLEKESCWYNSKIFNTGDLMYDSFLNFHKRKNYQFKYSSINEKFIFVTIHRADNTNTRNRLKAILDCLNEINKKIKVIFPIHPRTEKLIKKHKLSLGFKTIDPVGYKDSLEIDKNCEFIITDSGGLVKEAYWSNKLSISLLDNPVWPEIIELNAGLNCKPTTKSIMNAYSKINYLKPK